MPIKVITHDKENKYEGSKYMMEYSLLEMTGCMDRLFTALMWTLYIYLHM